MSTSENIFYDIKDFIRSNKYKTVCFCVGNNGCIKFIQNLIVSCNNVGLPLTIFSLDDTDDKCFTGEFTIVKFNSENIIPKRFLEYGTKEFKNSTARSNEILNSRNTLFSRIVFASAINCPLN